MGTNSHEGTVTIRVSKATLNLIVGLAVGLVLGFGIGRASLGWFRTASETPDPPAPPEYATAPVVEVAIEGRPSRGPEDAPVTLVEFTDYECPYCGQYFRLIYPTLLEQYGDRLRYVVRNFPLASIHPNAVLAAEAAECAHDQGKFWEYHDVLFERAAFGLDETRLKHYANTVELDAQQFAACLESRTKQDVVATDVREGLSYGIQGTPTFFINGHRLEGVHQPAVFRSFIEGALREAGHGENGTP